MKPIFLLGTCQKTNTKVAFNVEHVVRISSDGEGALVTTLDGTSFLINESVEDFVAGADAL